MICQDCERNRVSNSVVTPVKPGGRERWRLSPSWPAVRNGALRTGRVRPIMVAVATTSGYSAGNLPWILTSVIFTSVATILLFVLLCRVLHQGHGAFDCCLDAAGAFPTAVYPSARATQRTSCARNRAYRLPTSTERPPTLQVILGVPQSTDPPHQ